MPLPEIVTLAQAKAYLRVDSAEEDSVIQSLIDAATESALAYADAYDPEAEAPARLRLAILGHVASAYESRDQVDAPAGTHGLVRPLRSMDL